MITIFICDEDKHIRAQVHERVDEAWGGEKYIFECGTIQELTKLAADENCCPDAIFMDVQFGGGRGVELTARIQSDYPWAAVVFMASYLEAAAEIFEARPTFFLMKPFEDEKVEAAMERVADVLRKSENRSIKIKTKSGYLQIKSDNIYYIESSGRQLFIRMGAEFHSVRMKMADLWQRLPYCFVRCHESYMVNMNHIKFFNSGMIILTNGEEVPISRSRYKSAREEFMRYTVMR